MQYSRWGLLREERKNHLSWLPGHTSDTGKDRIGFLVCKSPLPGLVKFLLHHQPNSYSLGLFSLSDHLGISLNQLQDFIYGLVSLPRAHMGPPLKPVQVPLGGMPFIQYASCTTQLGVVSRLPEAALDPPVCVTNTDAELPWCQALRNATPHPSPLGHWAVDHNSLSATTQPIPYPPQGATIKSNSMSHIVYITTRLLNKILT